MLLTWYAWFGTFICARIDIIAAMAHKRILPLLIEGSFHDAQAHKALSVRGSVRLQTTTRRRVAP
jgi:hypothetical protein